MAPIVSRELAEACLAAVKEQFRTYLEPVILDACVDDDGVAHPARDLGPTCSEPKLVMDYDGRPAIVWEDGPDEWAYRVHEGGSGEEERVLVAQAAEEFGVEYQQPAGVAPATMPAGVNAEPIMSFVLGLYPDS